MKTNKKLRLSMLVLALVLAMTVLFCSCEQKPIDPPETTPAETTEEPLPETFDVVKDRLTPPRLLPPKSCATPSTTS